jgi:ribosomal protein L12E/L44/L45/RPP1/RPP2
MVVTEVLEKLEVDVEENSIDMAVTAVLEGRDPDDLAKA